MEFILGCHMGDDLRCDDDLTTQVKRESDVSSLTTKLYLFL